MLQILSAGGPGFSVGTACLTGHPAAAWTSSFVTRLHALIDRADCAAGAGAEAGASEAGFEQANAGTAMAATMIKRLVDVRVTMGTSPEKPAIQRENVQL